jgi:hypothetical protein
MIRWGCFILVPDQEGWFVVELLGATCHQINRLGQASCPQTIRLQFLHAPHHLGAGLHQVARLWRMAALCSGGSKMDKSLRSMAA